MGNNQMKLFKKLTVLLVLLGLVFSLSPISAVEENKYNSISFVAPEDESISNYADQLEFDLFEVASIAKGEDGKYSLSFKDPFKNMKSMEGVDINELKTSDDATKLSEITNEIAKLVANNEVEKTSPVDNKYESNKLYISFPHNTGDTKDKYIKAGLNYSSIATFDGNDFMFTPNLIFLLEEDLDVTIKATPLANLTITKELKEYAGNPVTFVFEVKCEDKVLDVVSLSFDNYGTKTVTVKDLPVGKPIEVEEVYSGASYKVENDRIITIESISTTSENSVTFKNLNDNDVTKGFGADNRYEYENGSDGQGHWQFKDRVVINNGVVKKYDVNGKEITTQGGTHE